MIRHNQGGIPTAGLVNLVLEGARRRFIRVYGNIQVGNVR